MTRTARKTYPTSCPFCHTPGETISRTAARDGVCCGSSQCLAAYNTQAAAAISARRSETAEARRNRPERSPVIAGEYGLAVLLANPRAAR